MLTRAVVIALVAPYIIFIGLQGLVVLCTFSPAGKASVRTRN